MNPTATSHAVPTTLSFAREDWFAFLEQRYEGHSRIQEIRAFWSICFAGRNSLDPTTADEFFGKIDALYGPF